MRRHSRFTALLATAVVSAVTLGGCSGTEDQPSADGASKSDEVTYLWAVGAADSSLVTSGDTTFLELRDVEKAITRFSDRPHREASEVDLRDFLARWDGRFAEVPPNAVLSYETEPDTAPVQVVVELSRPRYDEATSTIVFAAERLALSPDTLDGADHPVEEHEEIVVPARTGPVSVFIDSEGPEVAKGQIATIGAATASSAQALYDLETVLLEVQTRRNQELEGNLRDQLEAITAKNHVMGELSAALTAVNAALNASEDTINPNARAALVSYDIGVPQPVTVSELKAIATDIKSQIDAASNSQQAEMLRLQSLTNKRNEAYEMISSMMKKVQDNNSAILRNL